MAALVYRTNLPDEPPSMPLNEPPPPPHHVRTRRLKRLLRYVPRRAVFHRYPVVGRFADRARRRGYLWSLKPRHVRPALYLGSILALLPAMGFQLPLAFLLALFTRTNLMIAGGLQLITNPLTAAPIYYSTYRIGRKLLDFVGGSGTAADASGSEDPLAGEAIRVGLDPLEALESTTHWSASLGTTVAALLIGGTICGLALGLLLDLSYRQWFAYRLRHPKPTAS